MAATPRGVDGVEQADAKLGDLVQSLLNIPVLSIKSGEGERIVQIVVQQTNITIQGNNVKEENYTTNLSGGINNLGAVGREAHVHHVNFSSQQIQAIENVDLAELVSQLKRVRDAMRKLDGPPELDLAVAEIGFAERAAAEEDRPKVLEHLKKAGKWALDVAKEIGAAVAITAITAAAGL